MQTAQKVITTYRRKRILVCLLVALLTLTTTLVIRFISQRSLNQQRVQISTNKMVTAMDNILRPLAAQHAPLLHLVNQPCQEIHLTLRKLAASLQTVRSIALVQSKQLYCSSIFGQRNIPVHQLQPALPTSHPLLTFSYDSSLLKGTPVLIQWYPASLSGDDGVLLVINIELLGELIFNAKSALITGIGLSVGEKSFISGTGLVDHEALPGEQIIYRQHSTEFPFTISVSGPGASAVAFNELPGELPLALIISLLMTGIAWLATAGRMSFSREINLGIAAHEFTLWCQPLQGLRTRQCCGVEILLRWNNPRRGAISPDVFIPIAEGYNLILPLTRYVISQTAHKLALFPQDKQFHISINVAARHFANGELLRDLHHYWFSAHPVQQLVVELTERDVLQDGDHHMAEHLHFKGVKLAIDDFGMGHSSLKYLKQFPVSVVKIDGAISREVVTNSICSDIVASITRLCRARNMLSVAEFVENEEQAALLRELGCDVFQGYLYSKSLLPSDCLQFIQKRNGGNGA